MTERGIDANPPLAGVECPDAGPAAIGDRAAEAGRPQTVLAPADTEGGRGDVAPTDGALWLACSRSPAFFLTRFGYVYDALQRDWMPFNLWPSQVEALHKLEQGRLAVILKA